jgi:hypothetical protein
MNLENKFYSNEFTTLKNIKNECLNYVKIQIVDGGWLVFFDWKKHHEWANQK